MLVDQAYLELGGEDLAGLIERHENLVVARTFSKGWGLGGIRCGYALAGPALAGALDALRPPGSISSQTARAAELACARAADMRVDAAALRAERDRLAAGVAALDLEVVGGAGNYVTFRTPWSGEEAFAGLAARGLVVRSFGHEPLLAGVIRASHRDAAGERPARRGPRGDAGAPRPGPAAGRPGGRLGPARHRLAPHPRDDDRRARRRRRQRAGERGHRRRLPRPHADRARHATACSTSSSAAAATSTSTSTTPSRTAASRWARRSIARSATARASTASATPAHRWTRRSRSCTVDLGGRGVSRIDLALSGAPGRAASGRRCGRTCSTPWRAPDASTST